MRHRSVSGGGVRESVIVRTADTAVEHRSPRRSNRFHRLPRVWLRPQRIKCLPWDRQSGTRPVASLLNRENTGADPEDSLMAGSSLFAEDVPMFAFFSDRLGCVGSIVVSILGTLLLIALSYFL